MVVLVVDKDSGNMMDFVNSLINNLYCFVVVPYRCSSNVINTNGGETSRQVYFIKYAWMSKGSDMALQLKGLL